MQKEQILFIVKYKLLAVLILAITVFAYYLFGGNTVILLLFCVAALIYTLVFKQYAFIDLCGSIVFSVCAKWFLSKIKTVILNRRVNNV